MGTSENIKTIFSFAALFALILLCIVLIVHGILRWIGPSNKRFKRLNVLSWIAFTVLIIFFLINSGVMANYLSDRGDNANQTVTDIFINTSKISIKILILGIIVASTAILLFLILFCIYKIAKIFLSGKKMLPKKLEHTSKEFETVLKNPIVPFIITWGILAIFIILPLLMGGKDENENKNTEGMAQTWVNGIQEITSLGNGTPESITEDFFPNLIKYVLIFIIVLGVSIAVLKILYSIIKNLLKETGGKSLLDEYSNSIGVLAVGFALLLSFKSITFSSLNWTEMIAECAKSFAIVFFIIALAILTLEIIRLLLDMREELIRQEARYLFISLVGQATLLFLGMINSIYEAISNIIGSNADNNGQIDQIQERLKDHMINSMDEQINKTSGKKENSEITFPSFDRQITKK